MTEREQCPICRGAIREAPYSCPGCGRTAASPNWRDRAEKAEAALRLATERNAALLEALDPFLRVFSINAPLNLTDSTPVRDVIPGVWPTVGAIRRLAAAAKEGA